MSIGKAKLALMSHLMLMGAMASGPYGVDDRPSYSPTPCKKVDEVPGYHHEGIYSKQKKLRKGFGHKKMTRAQRRRLGRK